MNKQELIEKLESNKDECFKEANKYEVLSWDRQIVDSKALVYMQVINWVEQLSEQPKVTVPQFVADWIKECKRNATLTDCLKGKYEISIGRKLASEDFQNWVADNENDELAAKAWMFGYEVEKEPLFLMPVPYVPYPVHYCVDEDGKVSYRQGNAQKFTQEELDKHFPEIKQFAVPVPVEEVK